MMLTPAGYLEHDGVRTGRYRVGGERLSGNGREPWVSYAALAVAVVDEIQNAARHRAEVPVFNAREETG
ncbi:hypothetical protein [Streptomyces sp. PBH53]|uniref:hypothetical protein n=1 Tax=Streptomyces sp. PBH53 TaxID=1577075 RepID=UPI001AD80724|nr:hypothetical protein [Streptomyces sp. PBH53]